MTVLDLNWINHVQGCSTCLIVVCSAAAAAKSLQSCLTLCDPPPHRRQPTRLPHPWILQARTLEWVAISFSNAWKWKVKGKSLSCAAYQAPPSKEFSRQEYWSGVPPPSPVVWSTCSNSPPCSNTPNILCVWPDPRSCNIILLCSGLLHTNIQELPSPLRLNRCGHTPHLCKRTLFWGDNSYFSLMHTCFVF